jgi:HEAT repeat protein
LAAADKPTVSDWVEKLKDKRKETRLKAAKALGDLGSPAQPAAPQLVECLRDKDRDVCRQSAQALAQIGPEAVPALREALTDEAVQARLWAAEALGLLAPDAEQAAPVLIEAPQDKAAAVRAVALRGLLTAKAEEKNLEPVFRRALKDDNPYVQVLGETGLDQLKARAEGRKTSLPVVPVPVVAVQRLTPEQEERLQAIIDLAIRGDTDVLPRAPVANLFQAREILDHLGPEGIPVLVRGLNEAYMLKSSCAVSAISYRLLIATSYCNDPEQLDFVLRNLGRGVPVAMLTDSNVKQIMNACAQRKSDLLLLTIAAERQAEFNRLVEKLSDLPDDELRKLFKDKAADARLAALTAAALRRLHAEDDLIDRLNDSDGRVSQLARQSLVALSRGTDLGPAADAGAAVKQASQKRWRDWWKQQDQNPDAAKGATTADAPAAASPGEDAADAARLADAVRAAADADGRARPLAGLRDGKGVAYTDALSGLVGKLEAEARDQARTALEDRLAKLSVGALHEKLLDADAEVRRAPAAAVGQKMDREFAPELILLLADDADGVAAAARSALRSLSGEDFGPAAGADDKARAEAVKKWRAWWAKQQEK